MDASGDFGVISEQREKRSEEKIEPTKPIEEWVTFIMDTTGSYNTEWFRRTKLTLQGFAKRFHKFRAIFMNDNCGGSLDCTCTTCKKSVIYLAWTEKIADILNQFEHAKDDVSGGGDVAEKPACVLHFLANEYKLQKIPHGVKQTIIMFHDTVGHGCSIGGDSYAGGCPSPKTCGCMGDAMHEAELLGSFNARVCIVAPNRSLEDRHFAVYACMIAISSNGWVMALPDDQDKVQKFVLDKIDSEYNLSQMFTKLSEKEFKNKEKGVKKIQSMIEQLLSAVESLSMSEDAKELESALGITEKGLDGSGITSNFVPPGTVVARNLDEKEMAKLLEASKLVQQTGQITYLREAMKLLAAKIEIFIVTDPDEKGEVGRESITHRCNSRYRLSAGSAKPVAKKEEFLFAIPDREIADPWVRCKRNAERLRGRAEAGCAEMVKVYVNVNTRSW